MQYVAERFSAEDEEILRPYFTNLDGPVFALVNLPEVVKGALFARYSRSSKSLRRLFIDVAKVARLGDGEDLATLLEGEAFVVVESDNEPLALR